MKPTLAVLAFTSNSMWVSVQGDQSTKPQHENENRNAEAAMAEAAMPESAGPHPHDLQKGSSSSLRKGRKDTRVLTCGNGQVGNGTCPNEGECCSRHGWCETSAEHCGGSPNLVSTGDNRSIERDYCWIDSYCYGEACDSCCYGYYWYYDYYYGSWDQYCY